MMKRIVNLIVALCVAVSVTAQTATDKVQQKEKGKGTVTVTQSSAISDLINNRKPQQTKPQTPPPTKPANTTDKPQQTTGQSSATTPQQPVTSSTGASESLPYTEATTSTSSSSPKPTSSSSPQTRRKPANDPDRLMLHHEMDYSTDSLPGQKIFRGEHKARGWRLLIFTGGNKRVDRERAQSAATRVKEIYPGMPVYTHFYTPRWMTYCGNFHEHKEAERIRKELIRKGFKSACIVRTQIIVE